MGYKCAIQVCGLVRYDAPEKTDGVKRANGGKILEEMGKERRSRSKTLDRSRSKNNLYEGYTLGADCWADMESRADVYRVPTKNGKGRALRKDAVIGWAIIINPPAAMTIGWTEEDYDRFDSDTMEILAELEPRLFRPSNARMKVKHRDEGREEPTGEHSGHTHIAGDCIDENGRYCGNLINFLLMQTINREYPRMMRERNWELDDLGGPNDLAGRSVNEYIADKLEDAQTEAQAMIELAQQTAQTAQEVQEEAQAEAQRIKAQAEAEAAKLIAEAQALVDEADSRVTSAKMVLRDCQGYNLDAKRYAELESRVTRSARATARTGLEIGRAKKPTQDGPDY